MTPQLARILALVACIASIAPLACTTPNASHCGNQQGDDTCLARDPERMYCSICVAENDGCVDAPVAESCRPSVGSETVADDSSDVTTMPSSTGSSTSDPSTSTSSPSTTASLDSSTGVPTTSSATDPSASSTGEGTTTGEATTESSTGSASTGPGSSDEAGSGIESSSTGTDSDCGNGAIDPGEECDGNLLNGTTCHELPEFSGGALACDDFCNFDTTACAVCLPALGICTDHDQCCSGNCAGIVVTGACL